MTKKKVFDAETRKKLSGIAPCSSNFTWSFTPSSYQGLEPELQPVFRLKPMSFKEAQGLASADEAAATDAVRRHIVGWSNLLQLANDDQVVELEYKADETGGCTRELFEQLNMIVAIDISKELMRISGFSIPLS